MEASFADASEGTAEHDDEDDLCLFPAVDAPSAEDAGSLTLPGVLFATACEPADVRTATLAVEEQGVRLGGRLIPLDAWTPILHLHVGPRDLLVLPTGDGTFFVITAASDALVAALSRAACVLPLVLTPREVDHLTLVPPADLLPSEQLSRRVHRGCRVVQQAALLGAARASGAVLSLAGSVRPQRELQDSPVLEAQLRGVRSCVHGLTVVSLGAIHVLFDGTMRAATAAASAWHGIGADRAVAILHARAKAMGAISTTAVGPGWYPRMLRRASAPPSLPPPAPGLGGGLGIGAARRWSEPSLTSLLCAHTLALRPGGGAELLEEAPAAAACADGSRPGPSASPPVVVRRGGFKQRLKRTLPTLHHCLGALGSTVGALAQAKDLLAASIKRATVTAAASAYGPVGGRVTEEGWAVMEEVHRVPAKPSSMALLVLTEGVGRMRRTSRPGDPPADEPRLLGLVRGEADEACGPAGDAGGGVSPTLDAPAAALDSYFAVVGHSTLEGHLALWRGPGRPSSGRSRLDEGWQRSWACLYADGITLFSVDLGAACVTADLRDVTTIGWSELKAVHFCGGLDEAAVPAPAPADAAPRLGRASGSWPQGTGDDAALFDDADVVLPDPPSRVVQLGIGRGADDDRSVFVCADTPREAAVLVTTLLFNRCQQACASLVGQHHDEPRSADPGEVGTSPHTPRAEPWELVTVDDDHATRSAA